jgi:hypothetical protein
MATGTNHNHTELTLVESFLLLALDNKGKFLIDSVSLNHGVAGAVLMKLTILKKIKVERRRVHVIDASDTGIEFLDQFLHYINASQKPKRVRRWVHKLAARLKKRKYTIIANLIERGILKKEKNKFLGIIPYTVYPTVDSSPEDEVRSHLLDIIRSKKEVDPKSLMLLSLLEATKLSKALFSRRKEHKYARKRIKALTREFETNSIIHATIKEVCSAVITASTSAAVAVSPGSGE